MAIPKLTPEFVKEKIDYIQSNTASQQRINDRDRWLMYNGAIQDIVEKSILKEFKPETVKELINRLIPINVQQKIINKLANVYNEAPERYIVDGNELDNELLNNYETSMDLDSRMKEANRYFKLFKRNLSEIYLDEFGCPGIRNLPRHTYEVFSHSLVSPEIPDLVVKFIRVDRDPNESRFAFWTDLEHLIVDGNGKTVAAEMVKMENPNGINPIKILPFIYTNESTFSVNPIPDDDLLRMAIVFPLLISDLAFAIKYLSWSVVYTVGAPGNVSFSPNSIINMDFGPNGETPQINTVKPSVNIDETLRYIEFLIAILLSTKNLSNSAISGTLQASNVASGVSKALDSAESQEDKKDQQGYFYKVERQLWQKISKFMIPYWRQHGKIEPNFNREFSSSFEVNTIFRAPKVILSEREQIELSQLKIQAGLSTLQRELKYLYPDFDDHEIKDLLVEIMNEKLSKMQFFQTGLQGPPLDPSLKDDNQPSNQANYGQ